MDLQGCINHNDTGMLFAIVNRLNDWIVRMLVITYNRLYSIQGYIDYGRRCLMCVMVSWHGFEWLHRTHQTHTMTYVQGLYIILYILIIYIVKNISYI